MRDSRPTRPSSSCAVDTSVSTSPSIARAVRSSGGVRRATTRSRRVSPPTATSNESPASTPRRRAVLTGSSTVPGSVRSRFTVPDVSPGA